MSDKRPFDTQKELIIDALSHYKRVDVAAKSLGLHIRRMYRLMSKYNLRLREVLAWSSKSPAPGIGQQAGYVSKPEAVVPPAAKSGRDIGRLSASDFTGTPLGDVGSQTSHNRWRR